MFPLIYAVFIFFYLHGAQSEIWRKNSSSIPYPKYSESQKICEIWTVCKHRNMIIPHESFCNHYFNCSQGNLTRIECPNGQAFDGALDKCTGEAIHGRACRGRPIEMCGKVGDVGVYPENSAIFYKCVLEDGVGVQVINRCEEGYYFSTWFEDCRYQLHPALIAFIVIIILLLIGGLGFLVYRRCRKHNSACYKINCPCTCRSRDSTPSTTSHTSIHTASSSDHHHHHDSRPPNVFLYRDIKIEGKVGL